MCYLSSNKQIDISFCLPVFNVANYLEDCINSIISQCNNDFSYEILCIDDCSSDNSYETLLNLQKTIPQIKIYTNEENRGVSYTRNRLISVAKGKYIWFVDPDDMIYPDIVKLFFNEIEKNNENVILGNFIHCDENASYGSFKKLDDNAIFETITIGEGVFNPISETGEIMNAIWAGMFKRDFLVDNHLLFNEKMIAQEDTLFYYEFTMKLNRVIKYSQPCYIYRQRKSSVMHNKKSPERAKKYYESMRVMYEVFIQHFNNNNYRDRETILKKLHHMRHNIAITLAAVPDTKYVKEQLIELKDNKIYPYPFRIEALKTDENLLRRVIMFFQPIELFFWILHIAYKLR